MQKDTIKMEFEIISYNLLEESDEVPTEMKILYEPNIDSSLNFLSVVKDIVESFKIKDSEETNYYLDNLYEELWSEYFKEECLQEILKNVDKHDYSKFNVTIKELDEQFNLDNKRIKIIILCNGGNGDMQFFYHIDRTKTKLVPHIHCKYCGVERSIDLNKLEFIKDSFHSKRISELALNTVKRHQTQFIDYWNKIKIDGENVKFVMTI